MAERQVTDAKIAVSLVREYTEASSSSPFWRDVLECTYDERSETWRVVFEASPSFYAPLFKYEAVIDAKSGNIKSVKRLE